MGIPTILPDEPEKDDSKLWEGLRRFAKRLAPILATMPSAAPVLISGDWGVGKTSLLHALERELQSFEVGSADTGTTSLARPRHKVIWFHAWRYEGENGLLPALLRTIWEHAPPEFRKKQENRSRFQRLWSAALSATARLLPLVLSLAGAGAVASSLRISAADLSADKKALDEGAASVPEEDAPSRLWTDFAALVREAWPDGAPLIFIDDLDRCTPDAAVALLDSIRSLITGATPLGCGFVVALDRGVLAQAISKKFSGISGYDGNRYIEKVFPLSFSVPTPHDEDAARLVRSLLSPTSSPDEQQTSKSDEIRNHQDALNETLVHPLFANPRLMKRCINRFMLVVFFEDGAASSSLGAGAVSGARHAGQKKERALKDRALAKWIAAAERWPILRPLILRQSDEYWQRLREVLVAKGEARLDADTKELTALPGLESWLRTELFVDSSRVQQFREAEQRLRRWGM